jgi:uncharacterized protein (DUF488 family)
VTAIWTIGHSTRSREDLLALLRAHDIRGIADVRRFPASRRHPHFNRDVMSTWLNEAGVEYRHFEHLGGRRRASADSKNTALRHPAFRGYADYMATAPFQRALDDLIAWAASARVAVMCAESVWWQCHRSLIADALAARDLEVRHILDASDARAHRIHETARVEAGQVCYPGLL